MDGTILMVFRKPSAKGSGTRCSVQHWLSADTDSDFAELDLDLSFKYRNKPQFGFEGEINDSGRQKTGGVLSGGAGSTWLCTQHDLTPSTRLLCCG